MASRRGMYPGISEVVCYRSVNRIQRGPLILLFAALAGCAGTPFYRTHPGNVPSMTRQEALRTVSTTPFFTAAHGNFDECLVTVMPEDLVFNCKSHGVVKCPYADMHDPIVNTGLGQFELDLKPECPIHIAFAKMVQNSMAWANALYILKHPSKFQEAPVPAAPQRPSRETAGAPSSGGGLAGMFGGSTGRADAAGGAQRDTSLGGSVAPAPEESAPPRQGQVASDVDEPNYAKRAERPDDFALVIGIAKYRDIPEAQFADRDAQAMKRHLMAMGYPEENIISLIGDHATNSSIAAKLERWLPMNVNANSTVFVYYSGHGAPDAESKQAYLVPWDGQPGALAETAFPLSRFYKDLQKLPAKRVLVALDSCFSGAGGRSVLAKGARPLVTKLETSVPQDGKLVVFTASQADQISGTLEEQGHGAFTYYFLKGLNGEAASGDAAGHVTVGSLYGYLAKRVNAAAHRQEREQTPQLLPSIEMDGAIQIK